MSQSDLIPQLDIDFLPARYREQCAQRKTHLFQMVGVGLFAFVLLSCAGWQWHAGRTLTLELEAIAPIHERAHQRTVQLTTLKQELAAAEQRAELLTYLRHNWPKTQLVAAVVEPMPKSIKLSDLSIGREEEEAATMTLPSQRARNNAAAATPGTATKVQLSPAQEDLRQLRAEYDPKSTVINMAGETTDVSALHEYLGEIARHPLILKAELRSIEAGGRESTGTLFRAKIVIRGGYGQPNGPTPPSVEPAPPAATASDPGSTAQLLPPFARAGT